MRAVGKMRAQTVVKAVRHSVRTKEGSTAVCMEIHMLLEDYESRNSRLQKVMRLIEELVKQISMARKADGDQDSVWIPCEVCGIRRFRSPKELQKLAGLVLFENSSGKHKGRTIISRRGCKKLRYLLFEIAMSLVRKNPEFGELHHYYTTRKINLLKKMPSLMAIVAKLIRTILYHVNKRSGI